MEGKCQNRQDVQEDKDGKVREMGERTEIGEGTKEHIGSIEPTIADGLEQPTDRTLNERYLDHLRAHSVLHI